MYFVFSTLQSDTVRCPDKNRNTQSTGSDTRSQDVKCHCLIFTLLSSVHFSSVAQLCPILCDAMNYSMPGLPVHHQLLEFTQTHDHWVHDAIQPSHLLSSPSPPALSLPSIRVFSNDSALHIRWPKYWSFSFDISPSNEHPGLISFRMDWLDLLAVQGILKSLFKSISSLVLSLPYGPTLTSIHAYWKNHSFDYTDFCLQNDVSVSDDWLSRQN